MNSSHLSALIFLVLSASGLTACSSADSGEVTGASQHEMSDPAPASSTDGVPTLLFGADGSVKQTAAIVAGQPVRIQYDLARMTECRTGGYSGSVSWEVTPHLLANGQDTALEPVSRQVSWSANGPQDSVFTAPQAREFYLYFKNDGYAYYESKACVAYDSNNGQNFHFTVH